MSATLKLSIGMFNTVLVHSTSHFHCSSVEELAANKGISMAQVALAWCINKPGSYTFMSCHVMRSCLHSGVAAAVVGTTSLQNLKDVIGKLLPWRSAMGLAFFSGSVYISLSEKEVSYLEGPYRDQPFYMD